MFTATGGPPSSDDGADEGSGKREPMDWHAWMADIRQRVRADIRLATAAVPDSLPPEDEPNWTFTAAESAAIYAMRERREELLMLDRLIDPHRVAFVRWLIAEGFLSEGENR